MGFGLWSCGCCGCSDEEIVIFICNNNAIPDDDFDVFLEGTLIGTHMGNFAACVGEFFTTNTDIVPSDVPSTQIDTCCQAGITPLSLDRSLLIEPGLNHLDMINTHNNHNGNQGVLGVFTMYYDTDLLAWKLCRVILTSGYLGPSGNDFHYTFTL